MFKFIGELFIIYIYSRLVRLIELNVVSLRLRSLLNKPEIESQVWFV